MLGAVFCEEVLPLYEKLVKLLDDKGFVVKTGCFDPSYGVFFGQRRSVIVIIEI